MADDLGFSDIGCFGSEIETPHLDNLAMQGIRFNQMYNCARCCPSRASLLTGLYPHQAGIGHMVHDNNNDDDDDADDVGGSSTATAAYQGYLRDINDGVMTMGEVFQREGYKTYMVGKWHVGGEYPPHLPEYWVKHAGVDDRHPLPVQRGFDEHYGTLGGAGSYYHPPALIHNHNLILEAPPNDYYYTDAINDYACRMIRNHVATSDNIENENENDDDASDKNNGNSDNDDDDNDEYDNNRQQPFFLYVAHCAPHWPLHAPSDVINKYRGRYIKGGWDEVRKDRYECLKQFGLVQSHWDCSPRDEHSVPWDDDVQHKDWEDARMATYAAMIDIMDEGIGRIVETLHNHNLMDDTIIMFLSDNGGCAEFLKENGDEGKWPEFYSGIVASDGTQTIVGNSPDRMPGGRDTFMSYDLPWANASNAPFRLFKSWVHEGGIATPFFVHWPAGIATSLRGQIHHNPWIMMDIVATCYDVCGITYPDKVDGRDILPLEGRSFAAVFENNNDTERREPIFWEHQGNRAVRDGKWKLVNQHGVEWELYDMEVDRTELCNVASQEPERVKGMIRMWEQWATRCGVLPWPLHEIPEGEQDWAHVPWQW